MEADAFLSEDLVEEPARPDRGRTPDLKGDDGKYAKFMRNEPAWKESEIEVDPETGRRFQYWNVGMTRNAAAESRIREKVILDPIPHILKDQDVPLRGWYKGKYEAEGVRARPCYTDALLTQPYGGTCPVHCGFCYINNGIRGYRGAGLVVVDPRYPEKVRRQVSKFRTATAFYMSSFTDPFNPLEAIYGNTKGTATVALDNRLPMFFLTRQLAPDWTFDYLRANPYSYMQFSINTSRPDDWARLSPKAVSLATMVDQVRAFHRAGIYVSIQVNPIVAGITTVDHICELIHALASAGADHLIFKFVEIVYPSRAAIVRNMRAAFPDRADAFDALFSQQIGGVYTIDEQYRKLALDEFTRHCSRAGVTMALCYEYEYARNPDGSIRDKTGVSMGAKYLTADQCHGHRVPMFTRDAIGDPWREVESCPPSGCLTCSEQFPTGVPCGSEILASAPALTPAHLRVPAEPKFPTLPVLPS
jgi:DNA repair photolyase